MSRPLVATLLGCAIALAGCVHVHDHDRGRRDTQAHGGGPPPWAPAHGYRHKHHHGADLRFDAHLGVYVVIGSPHVYFHGGHYYRYADSHWERAGHWRKKKWKRVEGHAVPGKLVKRYSPKGRKHGKGKGKKKGHGPAKHGRY
ncbi:MAG: hypothetical protein ABFS41_11345 [Myxococcota bacterium]